MVCEEDTRAKELQELRGRRETVVEEENAVGLNGRNWRSGEGVIFKHMSMKSTLNEFIELSIFYLSKYSV